MDKNIKVGDIVRVTDWGNMFNTHTSWIQTQFEEGKIPFSYVVRYAYGGEGNYIKHRHDDDTKYKVLYIDNASSPKVPKILICKENLRWSEIYLLDMRGVELYDKPVEMTVSEIEKKLGVKNLKIVKEKDDE